VTWGSSDYGQRDVDSDPRLALAATSRRLESVTVSRFSTSDLRGIPPTFGGAVTRAAGSFEAPLRTFKLRKHDPGEFTVHCGGGPVLTGVHTLQCHSMSNETTAGSRWQFSMKRGFNKGLCKKLIPFLLEGIWLAGEARRGGAYPKGVCDRGATKPRSQSPSPAGRGGTGPSASFLGRSSIAADSLPPSRLAIWPGGAPAKIGSNF
jgi:hypothetical protein